MICHVAYAPEAKCANIHFEKCNFACKGCIRELLKCDLHLSEEEKRNVMDVTRSYDPYMVANALMALGVKKAILMGGEPTVNPELFPLLGELRNIKTVLLTNGYLLTEKYVKLLENIGLSEAVTSIKAYDKHLHIFYTGKSNRQVLRAIKLIYKSRIEVGCESVIIPSLIDEREIEKIAKYIASVSPNIPYRIDAYIPVPSAPWRKPTYENIISCVRTAKKHLNNVSFLSGLEKLKYEYVTLAV